MPKWEYCAIVGLSRYDKRLVPGDPAIWRFTPTGIEVVDIRGQQDVEAAEVAQSIATLGEQGWEMVGCGNTSQFHHVVYFKRPKPECSEHS